MAGKIVESNDVGQLKDGEAALVFHETGVDLYVDGNTLDTWTHAALAVYNGISIEQIMNLILLAYDALLDERGS